MAKVYCFGNTQNGELGLGAIEEEHILKPLKQRLPYDRRKYICLEIASGRNHTLVLAKNISLDRNVIFSCGSNERMQLGRTGSWKKLEMVDTLCQHNIIKVACGFNNSLVLSDAGQIFSWGCNLFGQLGLNSKDFQELMKPSLIKKLATKTVVQICCGGNHCLAMTKNGELYSFGSNAFGQLGIGSSGNCISVPTLVSTLQWTPIKQIAAGGSHSAILSYTGAVYLWGKNESGQLGLNDQINRQVPTLQFSLRSQKIAFLNLGEDHSAALTDEGGIFTWGAGNYGQLGHGSKINEILPRKVFELMGVAIIQVSCGRCHTLVANKKGRVYAFGLNGSGQLGIGSTQSKLLPFEVRGAWIEVDVKDVLLRCSDRSLFLVNPNVNKNNSSEFFLASSADQLRSNEESLDKNSPMNESSKMEIDEVDDFEEVSQGSSQSEEGCYVEEPDEEEFLLNDKPFDKSLEPQFVCDPKTVYSNQQSVQIDEYQSDPDSDVGEEESHRKQFVVKKIVASKGDQSFVLTQTYVQDVALQDFRQMDSSEELSKLDNNMFEQFKDISKDSIPLDVIDYIEDVFSSIPSWNASYISFKENSDIKSNSKLFKNLESDKYKSYRDAFINWSEAFHGFNMIEDAQNERLNELIHQSVLKILESMPDSILKTDSPGLKIKINRLDEEVMRVYQLLPLFHFFKMENNCSETSRKLVTLYADSILKVSNVSLKILEFWWCKMDKRDFKNLVNVFKNSIQLNLLEQMKQNEENEEKNTSSDSGEPKSSFRQINQEVHKNLACCLQVLQLLYTTNKNVEIVSYKDFYIHGISEMFDLKVDYYLWKYHRGNDPNTKQYFLCNFAFIFDPPAKNIILSVDSEIQQQSAAESSVYRQIIHHPIGAHIYVNPYLTISVHRNTILQETINQLCLFTKHSSRDFKKPLQVYFEGEEAIDAGQGMKKEFFLLLMKEILDEKYGMFVEYKETNTIWFHHLMNEEDAVMYELIGILCGLAIYNKVIIDLPFPLILYKKILKENLELDDLAYLDPLLMKNLKEILTPSFEKAEFDAIFGDMTFVITLQTYGSPVEYELCQDGKTKQLTYENREEYVNLYWRYILITSIKQQFKSFLDGFMKVLDTHILHIFQAEELIQMVSGQEVTDWEELEEVTEYKPPFTKDHPTIRLFWKVFYSFTTEQKKKFLKFLTGSDRIPILGVKALRLVIQSMRVSEEHLPVAHTCFNVLDLPLEYQSEDKEAKLRSKILKAVDYVQGFALV